MPRPLGLAAGLAAGITVAWSATAAAQVGLGRVPVHTEWAVWLPFAVTLIIVLLAGVASLVYLTRLQTRFLGACQAKQDLALFAQNPAGVPAGTVRSMLALFIVFVTLSLLALSMLPEQLRVEFPDVLSGILGTVLGFYFGSRSASAPYAAEAPEPPRPTARPDEKAGDTGTIEARVRDGVAAARAVARVLPSELGRTVSRVAEGVDGGLRVVDALRAGGRIEDAAERAGRLATELEGGEAAADGALVQAAGSFARALGGTVPPLAVALAVVGVGAKLAGAAYDRWVARVLHTPYTPELFPPSAIDANTGLSLILQCPIFREAFAAEVEAGDRAFVRALVERALSEAGVEELWREHAERFEDRARFDAGVDEFQRAAIRQEVLKDVSDEWAREVGGVDELLAAVDRLHEDEVARRDLDAIVLVADELKRGEGRPEAVFQEARQRAETAA